MNEFCARIAEILDVESLTDHDVLAECPEWDSLSVLSVIAMLDARYRINVTALQLKDVRTVGDLWALVQAKQPA